jgi:hypothetical protein
MRLFIYMLLVAIISFFGMTGVSEAKKIQRLRKGRGVK